MDFFKLGKRYEAFLHLENDGALLDITAPKDGWERLRAPKMPEKTADRWLDIEYRLEKNKYARECTAYFKDAFKYEWIDFGPDILGAICGCEIEFGQDTSWAVHKKGGLEDLGEISFDSGNKWLRRLDEHTKILAAESGGEYVVGITDLHPGMDALVSLRGPENLCIDIIETPETVIKYCRMVNAVFKKVFDMQYRAATARVPFTTSWMGVLVKERHYPLSCDFSCLISGQDFERFVVPELVDEAAFIENAIYHLDGPQALRHLDRLLEIDGIKGVQWVPGAGQKPMREWINVLRTIQKAGKVLDLHVTADDVMPLLNELNPKGLLLHLRARSESEAGDIIREAAKYR